MRVDRSYLNVGGERILKSCNLDRLTWLDSLMGLILLLLLKSLHGRVKIWLQVTLSSRTHIFIDAIVVGRGRAWSSLRNQVDFPTHLNLKSSAEYRYCLLTLFWYSWGVLQRYGVVSSRYILYRFVWLIPRVAATRQRNKLLIQWRLSERLPVFHFDCRSNYQKHFIFTSSPTNVIGQRSILQRDSVDMIRALLSFSLTLSSCPLWLCCWAVLDEFISVLSEGFTPGELCFAARSTVASKETLGGVKVILLDGAIDLPL